MGLPELPGPLAAALPGSAGDAPPAAVLLDMDGLLVDTEHLWTIAEEELAASYGRPFTPEMKHAMLGHGVDTAVPLMLSMLGVDGDPAQAARFLVDRAVELFRTPGLVMRRPGAPELLAALRAADIPTALVSSSFRSLMDPVLDTLGRDLFTITVAGDEVARRKPFPDPYLVAAAALAVDPARCVVLEDSTTGALAGLRAGCRTVLVPSVPGLPSLAEVAATTEAALATGAARAAALARLPAGMEPAPAPVGGHRPAPEDIAELSARLLRVASLHDVTLDFLRALTATAPQATAP
ncbi:HAD family hydrolase [Pseudofrankia sp. BMG5.37]|uniref:HAD family hydrolase n=1 Tax=Pseudofrankia sp. BMG5.37 TaxID=3050035 RepID=UPI0037CA45F6